MCTHGGGPNREASNLAGKEADRKERCRSAGGPWTRPSGLRRNGAVKPEREDLFASGVEGGAINSKSSGYDWNLTRECSRRSVVN